MGRSNRMSDSEMLEQTAEWLSNLANAIERVTERLAGSIEKVQAEQERQADEIRALSNRIEALTRAVPSEHRPLDLSGPGPRLLEP